MILCKLGEFEEFAEALFGQLSVEINEEKKIAELAIKAKEGLTDKVQFKELEDITKEIFPIYKEKVEEFLGVKVPDNLQLKFPELVDLKKMKGDKVFADKEAKEFVTELFNAVANEDLKKNCRVDETRYYKVFGIFNICNSIHI